MSHPSPPTVLKGYPTRKGKGGPPLRSHIGHPDLPSGLSEKRQPAFPPLVDDSIAAAPLDPLQPDKAVLGLYGMPSEPGLPLFTVQSLPPHLHVQSLDPVGLPKPGVVQLIKLSLSSTALVRAGSTGSF